MPKKTVAVDYVKCNPEKCKQGVCVAVGACEHGSLRQDSPYETPEINPSKWCHGCQVCSGLPSESDKDTVNDRRGIG